MTNLRTALCAAVADLPDVVKVDLSVDHRVSGQFSGLAGPFWGDTVSVIRQAYPRAAETPLINPVRASKPGKEPILWIYNSLVSDLSSQDRVAASVRQSSNC